MPRPLNAEWYSPAKLSLTSFRVVISIRRILAIRSFVSISRDFDVSQDVLDYLLGSDILGLSLEGRDNAVPEYVPARAV